MPVRETILHRVLKQPFVLHAGFDVAQSEDPPLTVVFLHGVGRTSAMWSSIADQVVTANPYIRVVTVDLLGFGHSARPDWPTYNAKQQARSLRRTLSGLKVRSPVLIVGHSLGALVAVEYAILYPRNIVSLLLASAPIYRDQSERIGRYIPRRLINESFYKGVLKNLRGREALTLQMNAYGRKLKLFAPDFVIDESNFRTISRTMEMAIENQSTYDDMAGLTVPTLLVYGRLDPFVIKPYYRQLSRKNASISVVSVIAGHEVSSNRRYSKAIIRHCNQLITQQLRET